MHYRKWEYNNWSKLIKPIINKVIHKRFIYCVESAFYFGVNVINNFSVIHFFIALLLNIINRILSLKI